MDQQQPEFNEWCIIELFGHQRMAGRVTQSQIGEMLRVDVPDSSKEDDVLYTRIINPKAIYALNPVSEEIAREAAKRMAEPPVTRWDMKRLLAAHEEDGDDLPFDDNPY